MAAFMSRFLLERSKFGLDELLGGVAVNVTACSRRGRYPRGSYNPNRNDAMGLTKQQDEIAVLEKAFWDSMIDRKPEIATDMLTEPAVMVSGHGANKFDHAAYTKMAKNDKYKLVDYTMSDMDVIFPRDDVAVACYRVVQNMEMQGKPTRMDVYDTSTWVKIGGNWRCVMHTESPAATK